MKGLENQVALVTGGSRGIGREVCLRLGKAGAKVIINFHRNERAAKETLEKLEGRDHTLFKADVSSPEEVRSLFDFIEKKYGRLDIAVNSAGIAVENHLDQGEEEWYSNFLKTMKVNLNGSALVAYKAVKMMQKNKSGVIVQVSSRGAFRGEPEMLGYGASKGAVNSFAQSLAQAAAPFGISVKAVAPGFVDTEMATSLLSQEELEEVKKQSPFGRIASPKEVAELVHFLCLPESEFLSGTIVDINGASYLRM